MLGVRRNTEPGALISHKAKEENVFKSNTRRDYKRYLRFIVDLLSTSKTDLALRIDDPNERVPYQHPYKLWECSPLSKA